MKKYFLGLCVIISIMVVAPVVAQDSQLRELTGHIAYIGLNGNLYTFDTLSSISTQITDNAARTRVYQWPTWANDGRLAYFSTEIREGNQATFEAYVSADGVSPGSLIYAGLNEFFNYAYWAPQNCTESENCRDLAVLLSSQNAGLFVQLLRDSLAGASNQQAGLGGPFYFSWSTDGTQMLWQRNSQRIDIYTVENGNVNALDYQPGFFQAPMWSPVDDRLLFATTEDTRVTDLIALDGDQSIILGDDLAGPVAFAWSPDGRYVAYSDRHEPLVVLNSVTGEEIARGASTGVYGFFWSPDSQHIAYVTIPGQSGGVSADARGGVTLFKPVLQDEEIGLSWSVIDIETSAVRRYPSFIPTDPMIYLLRYFDQFAQSHRVWSPDSRYLLTSTLSPESGRPVITALDATIDGSTPFEVVEGVIGIWSFQ